MPLLLFDTTNTYVGFSYVTLSYTSPPNPPIETIDPSLLMAQIVDSDKLSRHGMHLGDHTGIYDGNPSEADNNGSLFVPLISDDVLALGTTNGETPLYGGNGSSLTSLEIVLSELSGLAGSNDPDPGFPTLMSDHSLSTAQSPEEVDCSNRSLRSDLSLKVCDKTSTRQKSTK